MPCVSLFDQKITDRDAKHCVSTVGLTVTVHAQEKKFYALKGQRKKYYNEYSLQIFIVTVHEFLNSEI
ncbi:MAG: hypothetical protein LBB88_09315 [Planctomycetaceae bacterium]|nr:hypothetical protein [Planctomycetaceae bacterium]